MKTLFISSIINDEDFNFISNKSTDYKPSIAGQRFERMIASGLVYNSSDLRILSYPPIGSFPKTKKIFWGFKKTNFQGVKIDYIPLINLPILKQVSILFFTLLFLLYWNFVNIHHKKCILLNLVYIPTAIPSILISKFFSVQNCVLVPDVSSFRFSYDNKKNKVKSLISTFMKNSSEFFDHKFDSYIFLTKYMDSLINKKNKPFLIIEGMIDSNVEEIDLKMNAIHKETKYIMYAGSLREKYGIMKLVNTFLQIDRDDIELWIFGSGDQKKYIEEISNRYLNIKFFGLRPFKEVFNYEKNALLLVNPRPSTEEFTKYSFPSKTLEYMFSGTPLITTDLPGIPKEYECFLYTFEDESVDGMKTKLNEILKLSEKELKDFGAEAKKFAMEYKNNFYQTKKIDAFLQKL